MENHLARHLEHLSLHAAYTAERACFEAQDHQIGHVGFTGRRSGQPNRCTDASV